MTVLPMSALGRVVGRLLPPGAQVVLLLDQPRMLRVPGAVPPMLIVDALVRCTTDAAGQLVDKDGNPWVDLLATDAAEINPDDLPFRYRAIVTGPTFGRVMWTFEVPAGQITDLATGLSAALTEG